MQARQLGTGRSAGSVWQHYRIMAARDSSLPSATLSVQNRTNARERAKGRPRDEEEESEEAVALAAGDWQRGRNALAVEAQVDKGPQCHELHRHFCPYSDSPYKREWTEYF